MDCIKLNKIYVILNFSYESVDGIPFQLNITGKQKQTEGSSTVVDVY
jgi:hypothetical protein